MMQMMLNLGEMYVEPDVVKVPDGRQDHQSIFELEYFYPSITTL